MPWKNFKKEEAKKELLAAHRRAVQKTCYVVLAHAKLEAPLDEGALVKSGGVTMDKGGEALGVVHFGGGKGTGQPRLPYAVRWHEEEANFQHGRKNKYLLDPYNRLAQPTLKDAIRQETKEKF